MAFDKYAHSVVSSIHKSSNEGNYLYEDIESVPVICTPSRVHETTDITFKYLDMRKFFEFSKSKTAVYFDQSGTKNCINK